MRANKKIFILSLLLTVSVVIFFKQPVLAGPSLSLTGENWDLGTLGPSSEISSSADAWSITNNSNGYELIDVKVTSTGSWVGAPKSETTAINKFFLTFSGYGDSNPFTSTDYNWFNSLSFPPGKTLNLGLNFKSPPVGSEEGEHTITVTITARDWRVFACGDHILINHTAIGGVAPVDKSVDYGTVSTNLTGESKCWLDRNLGADNLPWPVTDDRESSAGWYWQFNRKQGYKHDGTTRTPASAWPTAINEDSAWIADNDPCTLELGAGWRLPTYTEWAYADGPSGGNWSTAEEIFSSVLRLYYAGSLDGGSGVLTSRGTSGGYWSSTQIDGEFAECLIMDQWGVSGVGMTSGYKGYATPARCIKD